MRWRLQGEVWVARKGDFLVQVFYVSEAGWAWSIYDISRPGTYLASSIAHRNQKYYKSLKAAQRAAKREVDNITWLGERLNGHDGETD